MRIGGKERNFGVSSTKDFEYVMKRKWGREMHRSGCCLVLCCVLLDKTEELYEMGNYFRLGMELRLGGPRDRLTTSGNSIRRLGKLRLTVPSKVDNNDISKSEIKQGACHSFLYGNLVRRPTGTGSHLPCCKSTQLDRGP